MPARAHAKTAQEFDGRTISLFNPFPPTSIVLILLECGLEGCG